VAPTNGQLTAELGDTGLARSGGVVREEFLRELHGTKGARTYREMADNDAICGSMIQLVETKLRGCSYSVQPADDTPAAAEVADFVSGCLDDMSHSWDDHLAEVVELATYGWSFHEVVYKLRRGDRADVPSAFNDGRLGWRKLPVRAQETLHCWEFDDAGGVQAMQQRVDGRIIPPIPIDKAILYRTTRRRNNPEGRSVLRRAYRSWWFRKRLEEVEAIGSERDLTGIPKMRVPARVMGAASSEDAAAKASWEAIGEGLRVDETAYVMIPSERDQHGHPMYDVELMSSPGNKTTDLSGQIERWARYAAMAVLADVILLGHEKVGSYALAATKVDMFDAGLQSVADGIAGTFTNYAVKRLVALNGWRPELCPNLVAGQVGHLTLTEIAEYAEKLARGGLLLPDPELERFLRSKAGMPDPDAEVV
jgi:hypothetical protein